jgi:WD40 repeat protein
VWLAEGHSEVARYDVATGQRLQELPRPPVGVVDAPRLALSPDGRLLAAVNWELPFPVWDTQTGEVAFVVGEGSTDHVNAVDWDGAGERLAVVATPEAVNPRSRVLIVSSTGAELGRISGEPGVQIPSLSFRGDGDVVATTADTARVDPAAWGIRLWDWRHDRLIDRIDANTQNVAFDPPGDLLITTRVVDNVVDVWDARTGERVSSLEGHSGFVLDVVFDATGGRAATASLDGSVRIWDPATGRQLVALRLALPVGAQSVAFSPDGRRLVTTWNDGITRIWTLDLDELVDIARDRVTRGLTTVECERYLHVDTCPQS